MKKMLIIHGWGSNSERWEKVKEILEGQGIEVFVPDLPGFGRASPPDKVWGIDEYKDWVLSQVKKKNWKDFYLLGHSFGGAVALKALINSSLIKSIIFVSPAILRRRKLSLKIRIFFTFIKIGKKIFSFSFLKKFYPFFQRIVYKLTGSSDYYLAKGIMKEVFKKVSKEDLSSLLEKVSIPALILWGKKDKIIKFQDAYLIKEKIKNSKLILLDEIGHSPHLEAPEKLAQIILDYLGS